jgi:hypothetical protein
MLVNEFMQKKSKKKKEIHFKFFIQSDQTLDFFSDISWIPITYGEGYPTWQINPTIVDTLKSLMEVCPNVELFTLDQHHLDELWIAWIEELKQGKWLLLKYITPHFMFTESIDIENYADVLLMRKDSSDMLILSNNESKSFDKINDVLDKFLCLTHLDMELCRTESILDLEMMPLAECASITTNKLNFVNVMDANGGLNYGEMDLA